MPKCKYKPCSKNFHVCTGCGLFFEEWDYCTKKCYELDGSPIYNEYGECSAPKLEYYCLKCNPEKAPPSNSSHIHKDTDDNLLYCSDCGMWEYVTQYT